MNPAAPIMFGTTTVRALLHVRAVHAVTGEPVRSVRAVLLPPAPPGWVLVVKRTGDVVVQARSGVPTPGDGAPGAPGGPPVRVRLTVADPAEARLLAAPEATVDLPAALTPAPAVIPALAHAFAPVPMTVTAVVVDTTGGAVTGATVAAEPDGAAAIALTEDSEIPGTYHTEARTWTAAETPFDLTVDGEPHRRLALDTTRTDTRVHVVSTT